MSLPHESCARSSMSALGPGAWALAQKAIDCIRQTDRPMMSRLSTAPPGECCVAFKAVAFPGESLFQLNRPETTKDYRPVLLISTETLSEFWLATARSGRPSRLKSPTAMDQAKFPAAKLRGARKLPSPLPKNTQTSSESWLATARSSRPSPLKSATATPIGVFPAAKFCAGWKVPSPLPKSTEPVLEVPLAP